MVPSAILAIYKSRERRYYIEKHEVRAGRVLAGHPCTKKALSNMAKAIMKDNENHEVRFKGLCPKTLLSFSFVNGELNAIWSAQPQSRQMFFVDNLGIPAGMAYQPRMVFQLRGSSLSVFGIKGTKTITEKTKLYLIPFHNTGTSGLVCLGSAKIPNRGLAYIEDILKGWEDVFYNSYFTHAGNLYGSLKFNVNEFWKELIATGKEFPESALIPCRTYKHVGDLLKQLNHKL